MEALDFLIGIVLIGLLCVFMSALCDPSSDFGDDDDE